MIRKTLNIFLIRFRNEIGIQEIPLLRGAVLHLLGENAELLFHNHTSETTFRYSYPLIQYKQIHHKAAILCVGNGIEAIEKLLTLQDSEVSLGRRKIQLEIENIHSESDVVQTHNTLFRYELQNWIPLNTKNYLEYISTESLTEKIHLLEHILIGNLLSFAKGVGIEIEQEIKCQITSLDNPRMVYIKGVKVMSFHCEFLSNLSLPNYIGIGKHVSLGCGTITSKTHKPTSISNI
jgi:hypothetical protein